MYATGGCALAKKDKDIIDCPRCFEQMDIRTLELKGRKLEFDICFVCDGVFLDDGELRKVTDNKPLQTWLVDYMGMETDSELVCPRCGSLMNEEEVQGVDVDICLQCHGIWFDGGELEEIKEMKPDDFKEIPVDRRAKKYDAEVLEARKKPINRFFKNLLG